MTINCRNCPLRDFSLFAPFTAEEVEAMEKFKIGEVTVEPRSQILVEGSNSPHLYTVLSGMGLRYKTLPDGGRQVTNFIFPGDFIGLQNGVMGKMCHSVEASTRMNLCVFERAELFAFFEAYPIRAFAVTWLAATEEHFLGEALTSVGQRSAEGRMAWALMKIHERLSSVGLVRDGVVPLPFRQQEMADALGMSLVHTNKTLARLRERQLITWSGRRLKIHDTAALADLAMMEPGRSMVRPLM